jgi:hypothetical protein
MSVAFQLLLAQYRRFWTLRARLSDVRLRWWTTGFHINRWAADRGDNAGAIARIAWVTVIDMLVAFVLAAALWVIAPYLPSIPTVTSEAAYVQLLSTIASVGGVFIGLYYTAITAAMTAVYARMPATVRRLLLEERFGNAYMRLVATTTFLALVLLSMRSLGVATPPLALPLLVVMSGVAVFGFVKLGTWAFRLFDPTAISHVVFRNLHLLLEQVKVGGYRWGDPAFQQYAQRGGARSLTTLRDLSAVCRGSEHLRDGALRGLAGASLLFAEVSVEAKNKIPTASRWFREIYEQPDWYRASDSETSIAHSTGTHLHPKSRRDSWWIETECVDVSLGALESFLTRGRDDEARGLIADFESYIGCLAQRGHLPEAHSVIRRLQNLVTSAILKRSDDDSVQCLNRVALADGLGRLWVILLLKAADWADSLGADPEPTQDPEWLLPETPYRSGLSAHALARAEWLAERLNYERMVKDATVTPAWYLAELLAQPEAEALSKALKVIVQDGPAEFMSVVDRLNTGGTSWPAASCLSEALHYVRKAQHHLYRLSQAADRLAADRRVTKLPWPSDDFSKSDETLTTEFVRVVEKMAGVLPHLPRRPDVLPDFPGQFLHTCVEEVFQFIVAGQTKAVAKVFSSVFVGCLAKHDELKPADLRPDDPWLEGSIAVALAPVLDLVELSGFSCLLSEAYPDKDTWQTVRTTWDAWLVAEPTFGARLATMLRFSKGLFAIAPRSILRTTWHQEVNRILAALPKRVVSRGWHSDEIVDHPSPIVRSIAASGRMMWSQYDGCDIFAACYLAERPGIQPDQLYRQAIDLRQQVARTRTESNDGNDDGGGVSA